MQYVERNWFCFEPRHYVDTHFSCSMHPGMSDDTCGPAQQLSLCIVGRSTCLCFPCGPIQLSVAFVRPSKHVLVVLGTVVEIVSILGDVFGVLAIGKSVTYSTHPIAHNMHNVCARVGLFEGDVQVSVCRSLKLLCVVVARGCSEFAQLSVGRGAAVRLCHATSTFRVHVVCMSSLLLARS